MADPPRIVSRGRSIPARKWDPKFPDVAEGDGKVTDVRESGDQPWDDAPADSHLQKFRFFDARVHRFLRQFGDGRSQIHVRFRAQGKRPASEYWYFFADHAAGAEVYEELKAAESPGEVVHARLTGTVPYKRVF